jgi:hypothetical protein
VATAAPGSYTEVAIPYDQLAAGARIGVGGHRLPAKERVLNVHAANLRSMLEIFGYKNVTLRLRAAAPTINKSYRDVRCRKRISIASLNNPREECTIFMLVSRKILSLIHLVTRELASRYCARLPNVPH